MSAGTRGYRVASHRVPAPNSWGAFPVYPRIIRQENHAQKPQSARELFVIPSETQVRCTLSLRFAKYKIMLNYIHRPDIFLVIKLEFNFKMMCYEIPVFIYIFLDPLSSYINFRISCKSVDIDRNST